MTKKKLLTQEKKDISDAVARLKAHTEIAYSKGSALVLLAAHGNRAALDGIARAKQMTRSQKLAQMQRNSKPRTHLKTH